MEQYRDIVRKHTSFTLDLLKVTSEEGTFRYSANFRPASTDALDINKPIGIPGMADWPSGQADQYYFVTVRPCMPPPSRPPLPFCGLVACKPTSKCRCTKRKPEASALYIAMHGGSHAPILGHVCERDCPAAIMWSCNRPCRW